MHADFEGNKSGNSAASASRKTAQSAPLREGGKGGKREPGSRETTQPAPHRQGGKRGKGDPRDNRKESGGERARREKCERLERRETEEQERIENGSIEPISVCEFACVC
jgi:hypothetical protein